MGDNLCVTEGLTDISMTTKIPEAVMIPSEPTSTESTATTEAKNDSEIQSQPSHLLMMREVNAKVKMAVEKLSAAGSDPYGSDKAIPPPAQSIARKRKAYEMDSEDENKDTLNKDSDDEDDDDVLPHHPTSEVLPRLPIYHPAFQLAESTSAELLQIITEFIEASGYKDDEAKHLLAELKAHQSIPYGDAVRIGLLGNAGVGKSALINSILGMENMTVESDGGDSCTYVPTEFIQAPKSQKTPFGAHVHFFCREMREQMIAELLAQWVKHHKKKDVESTEIDAMETEAAATTIQCFMQIFAGYEEFATEETAEDFLGMAKTPKDPRILLKLQAWTEEVVRGFVAEGDTLILGSNSPEKITEDYLPFTRHFPYASFNGKPLASSPWPLVRLIQVSLHHDILKQGIILADLPGVSDVSQARVTATNRYLQSCDTTICVSKSDRAETDPDLVRHYRDAFLRRRAGSVMIVVTRSDDLASVNNKKTQQLSQMDTTDEEILAAIKAKIADLTEQIKTNRTALDKARSASDKKALKELREIITRLSKQRSNLIWEDTELRILARNKKTANKLAKNYRAHTKDESRFLVFCVSNKAYMQHVRGYGKDDRPALSLPETQVPLLRSHIYSLPSKGKFATLDHHCRTSLFTLMSVMKMSCSSSTLERKEHLVAVVEDTKKKIASHLKQLFGRYRTIMKKQIESIDSSQQAFIKGAEARCKKYAQMSAASHRAFVRHYGDWKTKTAGAADWNAELLSYVRDSIDAIFAKLIDELCQTLMAEVAQAIQEDLDGLNLRLENDPAALVCDAYRDIFLKNLEKYRNKIAQEIDQTAKTLATDYRKIHTKCITSGDESYFTKAMVKVYDDCNVFTAPKGQTLHKTRCELFKTAVCAADGPFLGIAEHAEASSNQGLEQEARRLERAISLILCGIQKSFEIMSRKKDNDTPEGKAFRNELHALVDEAENILDGPIQAALGLCRDFK